jgi:hypothetical protein
MDFWCSNVGDLIRGKSDFNTPCTIAKVVSFINRIHLLELRTPLEEEYLLSISKNES